MFFIIHNIRVGFNSFKQINKFFNISLSQRAANFDENQQNKELKRFFLTKPQQKIPENLYHCKMLPYIFLVIFKFSQSTLSQKLSVQLKEA